MDAITKIERDVGELHESLANHITDGVARDAEITYKIEGISSKIEELNTSIKGLVTVWEQAQGILTFVKWLFGISGSVVAIIAFFKGARG